MAGIVTDNLNEQMIGVSILESSEEDMGRHAYLHSVKKEDTENFQDRYEHYRELYFFG